MFRNQKSTNRTPRSNTIHQALGIIFLSLWISSCAPESSTEQKEFNTEGATKEEVQSNVIYGIDGRLDLYQVSDDRLKRLARSTVALIKSEELTVNGTETMIKGKNYGTSRNLCASEKFREQNTSAFCSGFLVRSDVIVTAGHCIQDMRDCSGTKFVFGFAVEQAGVLPSRIPSQDVYGCAEVLKTFQIGSGADYAVIRLDRRVQNREPLKMRNVASDGPISIGEELVVIGHPVGLPSKVTAGGRVRANSNPDFFVGNVDTYGGNSGSAVFNQRTGLVEGILVRGETDFAQQGSCVVSKVCTEDSCRGEDITRISQVAPFIPSDNGNGEEPPPPPPVQKESFRANVNRSIPDNNQQGILNSLTVGSASRGRKVSILVQLKHPFIGDLQVQVILPDGKVVTLHNRAGGGADDINKSFEITSQVAASVSAGNYRLVVKDLARRDVGQLVSWGVDFE